MCDQKKRSLFWFLCGQQQWHWGMEMCLHSNCFLFLKMTRTGNNLFHKQTVTKTAWCTKSVLATGVCLMFDVKLFIHKCKKYGNTKQICKRQNVADKVNWFSPFFSEPHHNKVTVIAQITLNFQICCKTSTHFHQPATLQAALTLQLWYNHSKHAYHNRRASPSHTSELSNDDQCWEQIIWLQPRKTYQSILKTLESFSLQ